MQQSHSSRFAESESVPESHVPESYVSDARPWDILGLTTVASVSLCVAQFDSAPSMMWLVLLSVLYIGCPWLISIASTYSASIRSYLDRLLPIVVALSVVVPIAIEVIRRRFGDGDAWEIIVLCCLQNGALIAAAYGHRPACRRLAVLIGSFLVLFVVTLTAARSVLILAGIYGVLLIWWLMAAYWEKVRGAVDSKSSERCLPVRMSVFGVIGIALLMLVAVFATSFSSTFVMSGIMPSSGGDSWSDEFARAGVGDGDAMVAAKESAMSFGPVESDLFLESKMPSLYDMFSEIYGDPPKPNNRHERAIALASENVEESHQHRTQSTKSGREFSTLRRLSDRNQETARSDRDSSAMMYVVGKVPVHLALERFNTFDGRTWNYEGDGERDLPIRLKEESGKPWAYFSRLGASPYYRGVVSHKLKIVNIKTNRYPSPPHLAAVHIDKVNSPEFFGWTEDRLPCMPVREHLPQLTVMHLRSHAISLHSLRQSDFTAGFPKVDPLIESKYRTTVDEQAESITQHLELRTENEVIAQFAEESTREVPRGWQQVEAIVSRLRKEFIHDRRATAPEECQDVVVHFLETGRGPDYLFATTAAILLRQLGYPTRLVAGFYANEDRYDRRAEQTTVLAEDVHFWVEVNTGGRTWVPIEPTPGYAPPAETLYWSEWASHACSTLIDWCFGNVTWIMILIVVMVLLAVTRQTWLDIAACSCFFVLGLSSVESRLRWTIRLLEFRARLVGCPRPRQKSIANWYAKLVQHSPPTSHPSLRRFLQWSDRLLYSSDGGLHVDHREVTSVCASVRSLGSRRALRQNLNTNQGKKQ